MEARSRTNRLLRITCGAFPNDLRSLRMVLSGSAAFPFVAEKVHLAERKSYAFPAGDPNDPRGSAAEQRHSLEEGGETDGEAELRRSATRQTCKP